MLASVIRRRVCHLTGRNFSKLCTIHSLKGLSNFRCEKLQRSLISLVGVDSRNFIQGLVTNDIKHLEDNGTGVGADCIYALMLNVQGRVLYDTIIYKMVSEDGVLLECDRQATTDVLKHLKMYKLRKKVDISVLDEESTTWAIFPHPKHVEFDKASQDTGSRDKVSEMIPDLMRSEARNEYLKLFQGLKDVVCAASDPRLGDLGFRISLRPGVEPTEILKVADGSGLFRVLRYKLGIGEGIEELPPGQCFPLECNTDYLHGVSFHKGCYLGQELTARTHHTGVTRKRLMPLQFVNSSSTEVPLVNDAVIVDEKGKNVGKIKAYAEDSQFGLGLLRIQESLQANRLFVANGPLQVKSKKPGWWPKEVAKESLLKT